MKKKILSLLLVIAMMVTSVSMGFSAISAFAAPAGKGIEAINAFSLTGGEMTGTSFTGSITIKSKVSGYQIKVHSVNASIRYSADENGAGTTGSVLVDSSVNGAVCTTSGKSFNVTGTIGAGLAGLVRYECSYDLLDANGNTVYAGMTGYGHGVVSANGKQTGAVGTYSGKPSTPGSRYELTTFNEINSIYVQTPSVVLNSHQKTTKEVVTGASSKSRSFSLSGSYPNTITVRNLQWDYVESHQESNVDTTWFEMNSIPNGYYSFTVNYDGSAWKNVEMYYRSDSARDTSLNIYNQNIALGLEKSYYTEESWATYLNMLELTALVGMGIPGPNYAYGRACALADAAAGGTHVANAKAALVEVNADYTAVDKEYNTNFAEVKNKTTNVTTYVAGATSYNSTGATVKLYDDASIKAIEDYYSSINRSHKRSEQKTVDGYRTTLENMRKNLAYANAVYTYLDVAINEYSAINESLAESGNIYTTASWNAYKNAVDNAKGISRDLKADSQAGINSALVTIFNAKRNLEKLPADFTELNLQISRADEFWTEYNSGKLLTAMDKFDEVWAYFVECYNAATTDEIKESKIDQQDAVNTAATNLREVVNVLSRFRLLDTTELEKALELWPEYGRKYYEQDSYNTWSALWDEGSLFSEKAAATYTGDDRKTYENYEEMVRLTDIIINAFESLEKIKADFTELNEVIAQIPSDEELALYEDEYVNAIKSIVATIDYGATFDEQESVDAITEDLIAALAELTYAHYKPADYSKVDEAIAEAEALDRKLYTNYSIVTDAINAVDRTKKIVEQAEVDAMEAAIRQAMNDLQYVPADYTEVEKAIEEAYAVENKDWYANYNKVLDAINAVDRTKHHGQQAEVDAMAAAIREAVANLKLADADYAGIREAIAAFNALAPHEDFYSDTIDAVDSAIAEVKYGLKADEQDRVDAWQEAIEEAIAAMKLLPADYSRLNVAIAYANSFDPEKYTEDSMQAVKDAINAVDWELDCRQNAEMNAQITAINEAVSKLELLPADYTKVDEAIDAARYAYQNGEYPYTEDSIQAVENVIASIDRGLKIDQQADVDAYIVKIQIAVAQLTYVRADYTALDLVKAKYDNLQRDLYSSLSAVDAYVAKIDWNKKIDKQSEVDVYAAELDAMINALEYAPADYTAVDNAITIFNSITRDYYEDTDLEMVEIVIAQVNRELKKDEQARVNQMAQDINDAIAELRTKMKKADLSELNNAVAQAMARFNEMSATGYEIDYNTVAPLDSLLVYAETFDASTTIDKQSAVDETAANIIEATANLEFVFTIILDGSGLVIEDGYIYGFEEGSNSADAKELIRFVGAAEIKIIETKNGFGTGTIIQFISTKDGSVIKTYTVLVFGDANGDAVIDMFDVAYIVEIVNNSEKPSDMIRRVLDITNDGYLEIIDVTIMIGLANMDATLAQDGSMLMS